MCVTLPCMSVRLILLALVALPAPARAQGPLAEVICAPRAEIIARLRDAEIAGAGLRDGEALLEIWTRASGDWTLVQSYPNGTACILAMGEVWEPARPPA